MFSKDAIYISLAIDEEGEPEIILVTQDSLAALDAEKDAMLAGRGVYRINVDGSHVYGARLIPPTTQGYAPWGKHFSV